MKPPAIPYLYCMKKIFQSLILCCLAVGSVYSQQEGTILFEQKANLHRRITAENEDMKKMIPEFRTSNFELLYTETTSLYRPVEDDEPNMGPPGGGFGGPPGPGMRFRMPEVIYYRTLDNDYSLTQRSIFEKKYLVEDTLRIPAWKLSNENKEILGMKCMKATLSTEVHRDTLVIKNDIIAWYAPAIYSPFGPESYGGLPGMILALDINKGEMTYIAKSINPKVDKSEIKAPSKGEKISALAFQKLMDERMKEMMKNGRGRGGMMRF